MNHMHQDDNVRKNQNVYCRLVLKTVVYATLFLIQYIPNGLCYLKLLPSFYTIIIKNMAALSLTTTLCELKLAAITAKNRLTF